MDKIGKMIKYLLLSLLGLLCVYYLAYEFTGFRNQRDVQAVAVGMSLKQVIAIMGQPEKVIHYAQYNTFAYQYYAGLGAPEFILIRFRDSIVTEAAYFK